MNAVQPTYDELRTAALLAQGENLATAAIPSDCLQVLIELGILVIVGGGVIETTSHGERVQRRLRAGERIKELELSSAGD